MCNDSLIIIVNGIVGFILLLILCLYEWSENGIESALEHFISGTLFFILFFSCIWGCMRCSQPTPQGEVIEMIDSNEEYWYVDSSRYCKYVIEDSDTNATVFMVRIENPDDVPPSNAICDICHKCFCDHTLGQISEKEYEEIRKKIDEYEYNVPY